MFWHGPITKSEGPDTESTNLNSTGPGFAVDDLADEVLLSAQNGAMKLFVAYFSSLIIQSQRARCVAQELNFVTPMHSLSSGCVAADMGHVT